MPLRFKQIAAIPASYAFPLCVYGLTPEGKVYVLSSRSSAWEALPARSAAGVDLVFDQIAAVPATIGDPGMPGVMEKQGPDPTCIYALASGIMFILTSRAALAWSPVTMATIADLVVEPGPIPTGPPVRLL